MTSQHLRRRPFADGLRTAAVLFILVGCALFLRSFFLLDQVFRPGYVCFQENDPWYHVRAIEYLVEHFPNRITWDPYALHPGGQFVAIAPLFDYAVAIIALLLGAGRPSLELTHAVAAWFPAVLGSLIPLPVYFLGRLLWNRTAGLLAAATIAFLPGPFFQRSSLGYTDHHVAESLLSLLTVSYLFAVLRWSGASNRAQPHERKPPHPGFSAVYCGVSLGCYLLSWVGGSLLVLTLFISFLVQLVFDYVQRRSIHRVCLWIGIAWIIALGIVLPFHRTPGFTFHIVALIASGAYIFAAAALSWVVEVRRYRRVLFPCGLLLLALGGLTVMRRAAAGAFDEAVGGASRFISGQAGSFLLEARPLLYENGVLSLRPAYEMFQAAAVAAFLAFGILLYQILRELLSAQSPEMKVPVRPNASSTQVVDKNHRHPSSFQGNASEQHQTVGAALLLTWTAGTFLATLVQERFAYYLALNIALLSGYFWSRVLEVASRRWKSQAGWSHTLGRAFAFTLFIVVGLYPSANRTFHYQARLHTGPHTDWRAAMDWLRSHSPEPFDTPVRFTEFHDLRVGQDPAVRPRANYSVMCSWDHGYWITGLARRVPTANPTQSGLRQAAAFFAAQDEDVAAQILTELDARYVVVDADLPVWYSKATRQFVGGFGTIADLAGRDVFDLYEPYFAPSKDGTYKPVVLYYPEYYRSMLNRLYLFGGEEYIPNGSTRAVRYSTFTTETGIQGKQIEESLKFRSYEEAVEFVDQRRGEAWRIVGLSPTESCVPLAKLRRFHRVYQSPTQPPWPHPRLMGVVEIFEHTSPIN